MDFLDRINLKLNYNRVGEDSFGNKYYEAKKAVGQEIKRRVVRYKIAEPTCVPPMWHAWIHYMKEELPSFEDCSVYSWQKEYSPNVTGLKISSGLLDSGMKVSADYDAWNVNK